MIKAETGKKAKEPCPGRVVLSPAEFHVLRILKTSK
jgi:hypothetical protein